MKAVILAAGFSSRLHDVTGGKPKCLLKFGDRTILDYQLDSLFQAGISSTAVVVGYGKNYIMDHVAYRHPDKFEAVQFIENPWVAVTDNMYSLWLARKWLGKNRFICLNADVLFHPDVLPPAVRTGADISVIIDREFREETTKVVIHEDRVLALNKSIPRDALDGTFIGIASFSERGARMLFAKLHSRIFDGEVKQYYNDIISELAADGVTVNFTETEGLPWAEVDDASDLAFAQAHVYPRLKTNSPFDDGKLSLQDEFAVPWVASGSPRE